MQRFHRELGEFFPLGHDTDKISLNNHGTNARYGGDRISIDRLQGTPDKIAMIVARIRRSDHAPVQHAGDSHVMDKHGLAHCLGRDIDPRQALPDDPVVLCGFNRYL